MQIGNMKVFPNANRKVEYCCMCDKTIQPRSAYVHHYKVDGYNKTGTNRKPPKPSAYMTTYTRQLHFCSLECCMLKGLEGVYEDG